MIRYSLRNSKGAARVNNVSAADPLSAASTRKTATEMYLSLIVVDPDPSRMSSGTKCGSYVTYITQ